MVKLQAWWWTIEYFGLPNLTLYFYKSKREVLKTSTHEWLSYFSSTSTVMGNITYRIKENYKWEIVLCRYHNIGVNISLLLYNKPLLENRLGSSRLWSKYQTGSKAPKQDYVWSSRLEAKWPDCIVLTWEIEGHPVLRIKNQDPLKLVTQLKYLIRGKMWNALRVTIFI